MEIAKISHRDISRRGQKTDDFENCTHCGKKTKWTAKQPGFKGKCWECTIQLAKDRTPIYIGIPMDIEAGDDDEDEDI